MRLLLLSFILILSGCASTHQEGTFNANYAGVSVAATWKIEATR